MALTNVEDEVAVMLDQASGGPETAAAAGSSGTSVRFGTVRIVTMKCTWDRVPNRGSTLTITRRGRSQDAA